MQYFGNIKYIIATDEPFWFVVGLITGAALMAFVDFMIDRASRKRVKK